MTTERYDVAVIGGGIVGLATARALLEAQPSIRLIVLEAEDRVGTHQTGHNSGVIHSGLYYKPGSLKARMCTEGRNLMYRFCEEHSIRHERCGKIVVATSETELSRLQQLYERGEANGLTGMRWLSSEEIREHEPHSSGIRGLFVRETGIVDYKAVVRALARVVQDSGGNLRTGRRVVGVRPMQGRFILETDSGEAESNAIVNCSGLHCDRVARLCGVTPDVRIIPFRGEYYELVEARRSLVRNLIYPVPDPNFPFLGVHFTRMIGGGVEAGPNAVLAFKREGYRMRDFSLRDISETLAYSGFWRMAQQYWKTGMGEFWRSISKDAFVTALQRLLPELTSSDLRPGGSGVRAQAVNAQGKLIDDFSVVRSGKMVHVLNAPSPAATASLSIGRAISEMALSQFAD